MAAVAMEAQTEPNEHIEQHSFAQQGGAAPSNVATALGARAKVLPAPAPGPRGARLPVAPEPPLF
eukprot:366709-Lingulodinium_polyedra.AAC.1